MEHIRKWFISLVYVIIFSGLCMPLLAQDIGNLGEVKWTFVVYSDNRGSNKVHQQVLKSMAKVKPEIIINLGDVVFRSEDYGTMDSFKKDVEEYYGKFDEFNRIFYPAIGGHEERYYNQTQYPPNGKEPDNEAGRKFYDEVQLKDRIEGFNDECGDYYFSHKNVHFVILYRSDEWKFKDCQVKWLEDTLKKVSGKGTVIVAGHAGGWFLPNPLHPNQTKIVELLRKYKVDIALAADWHDYFAGAVGDMMMFRSGSAGWGDGIFIKFEVTDKGFIISALEPDGVTPFTKYKDISPRWIKIFGKPGQEISVP